MGSLILSENTETGLETNKRISAVDLLERAFLEAFEMKHPYVGTEHLLLALYKVASLRDYKKIQRKVSTAGTYPQVSKRAVSAAKKTPILDAFGVNLSQLGEEKSFGNLVDRPEVETVIGTLLQQRKANPILVGEEGVGKNTLVRLLAQKISSYDVPVSLINYQIIEFDLTGFLNSVMGREGVEVGFSSLHEEILNAGDIILYIPDFHSIFLPVSGGLLPNMAATLFKTYLLHSGIQFVVSTTPQSFQKYVQEDEELVSSFTVVRVKEPDKASTLKILYERKKELEKFHNITIGDNSIIEAYNLSESYLKNRRFPQKAIDLLDKACSLLLLSETMLPRKFADTRKKKYLISESLNKAVLSGNLEAGVLLRKKMKSLDLSLHRLEVPLTTHILSSDYLTLALSKEISVPVGRINKSEGGVYENLEEVLLRRIVGQEKAVKALSTALIRSRLGLRTTKRPIGNFLFLGPTGVGKTELAKVLSEVVFGKAGLIKIDMSDFSEKHSVSRLVGAPPGYVGYSEGGELTEKISRNPYSVVLFDELEKAHPDVLNILLQIMEDGVLVDARGRPFDFTHSILILTSNLGSELINKEELGFSLKKVELSEMDKTEAKLMTNLKGILRPELLNRFDDIIIFNRISRKDAKQILNLMLKEAEAVLKSRNIDIKVSDKMKEKLLNEGFSQEYGARALRRVVEKRIVDEIAALFLKKRISESDKTEVEFTGSEILIN